MAISNSQLIRDALGLIGVLGEVEAASPEQATHGLRVLNRMILALQAKGIDLQYYEQTDPGADTPIPPEAEDVVLYFLAFKLAPSYGKTVSLEMRAEGAELYATLVRNAVIDQLAPIQTTLPRGEGDWIGRLGNILTGD